MMEYRYGAGGIHLAARRSAPLRTAPYWQAAGDILRKAD